MYVPFVLALSCYVSGVLSGRLGPCKKQDNECVQKEFSKAFDLVVAGIPSMGLESLDPMFVNEIEGNLSGLKFKLTNTTITGYKNCNVNNIKIDLVALKASVDLNCNNTSIAGDYEINGQLLVLPIEGKGDFHLTTTKYFIAINENVKVIQDKNGKSYLNVKNYTFKPKSLGPITFKFNNLFNGQKDLSDAVHKFANENYNAVAELVQDPIINESLKIIVKNINKFLRTEPLEEIFVD